MTTIAPTTTHGNGNGSAKLSWQTIGTWAAAGLLAVSLYVWNQAATTAAEQQRENVKQNLAIARLQGWQDGQEGRLNDLRAELKEIKDKLDDVRIRLGAPERDTAPTPSVSRGRLFDK